jgi:hypothetical protein
MIFRGSQEKNLPEAGVHLILSPPSPSARAFLPFDPWFWCMTRDLFPPARYPGLTLMTASGNGGKGRFGARVAQR